MSIHIDCQVLGIRSPKDRISIRWEVQGCSGSTECDAWLGQFTIEQLEAHGYTVLAVEKVA